VSEHDRPVEAQALDHGGDVPGVGVEVVALAVVGEPAAADVEDDRADEVGELAGDEVHGDRGARDARDDQQRGAVLGPVVQEVQSRRAGPGPAAHRRDLGEVGERRLGQDALGGRFGHRSAFRKGSSR
jgi:hypothetical protein